MCVALPDAPPVLGRLDFACSSAPPGPAPFPCPPCCPLCWSLQKKKKDGGELQDFPPDPGAACMPPASQARLPQPQPCPLTKDKKVPTTVGSVILPRPWTWPPAACVVTPSTRVHRAVCHNMLQNLLLIECSWPVPRIQPLLPTLPYLPGGSASLSCLVSAPMNAPSSYTSAHAARRALPQDQEPAHEVPKHMHQAYRHWYKGCAWRVLTATLSPHCCDSYHSCSDPLELCPRNRSYPQDHLALLGSRPWGPARQNLHLLDCHVFPTDAALGQGFRKSAWSL